MNDGRLTAAELRSLMIVLGISLLIFLFLWAVYQAARRKGEKILEIFREKQR